MSVSNRVRVHEVVTLSDNWYIPKTTRFSFQRSDGTWQEQNRETYDRGNGATILLYNLHRRTVILTRQFRCPAYVNGHDDLLIEAPAGLLDDASPEVRIRAEVEEETGYRIGNVEEVLNAYMSPGSVTERPHFFVAPYNSTDRIGEGGGNHAEGEDIGVIELTVDDALDMVGSGKIRDGKTIILLQYAALHLFSAA